MVRNWDESARATQLQFGARDLVGLHASWKCTAMHLFTLGIMFHAEKPPAPSRVIVGCSDKPAVNELAVGLLTAKLCQIRGADRVIVIDVVDYRLEFAKHKVGL